MQQDEPQPGDSIGPLDWYKIHPFEAAAVSDRLEWVGLEAALPCDARFILGIQRARPYPPHAHPLCPAAGGAGPVL
jgi:hypothetical protein